MSKRCFSIAHVARPSKNLKEAETPTPVPKVSTLMETGPQPPKVRKREATAECVVAIFPYTQDASTIWESCREAGQMLWQIQVEHNARDSITVGFRETFTKFLQQEEEAPESLTELAEQNLMKLVITDNRDPDGAGFIQWRAAFYVAGQSNDDLHNFLYLLDAFFVWANKDRSRKITTRSLVFFYCIIVIIIIREGNPCSQEKQRNTLILILRGQAKI